MNRDSELKRTAMPPRKAPLARSALDRNAGPKRRKDTGPSAAVRRLVAARSGGMCESATCAQYATDAHHRLGRKAGGRHGEMAERINQPAWLLHVCRLCHSSVTSPHGEALTRARAVGWLLMEGQDALHVPVVSRHGRVWLRDDGGISETAPPIFPTA